MGEILVGFTNRGNLFVVLNPQEIAMACAASAKNSARASPSLAGSQSQLFINVNSKPRKSGRSCYKRAGK